MLFNVDAWICKAIYPGVIVLDRDPRLRAGGRAGGQVSRRPWVAPAAGGRGGPFRAAFPPVRAVAAAPDRRGGLQTTRLNHPAFYAFVFDSGIAVAIRASLDFFFCGKDWNLRRQRGREPSRPRKDSDDSQTSEGREALRATMYGGGVGGVDETFL